MATKITLICNRCEKEESAVGHYPDGWAQLRISIITKPLPGVKPPIVNGELCPACATNAIQVFKLIGGPDHVT